MKKAVSDVLRDVDLLERAATALAAKLGVPLFISEHGKSHFVVPRKDSFTVQVLKAVRVVSGLRASATLLRDGFVQEAIVVFRTIDDFLKEIMFLEEAHVSGAPVAAHLEFVEQFFAATAKTTQEMLADQGKTQFVSKGKIRASQTRFMHDVDPNAEVDPTTNAVDKVLNGYVHGGYSSIMEMYDPDKRRFRMDGMPGTPRLQPATEHLAIYTERGLSIFSIILRDAGILELAEVASAAAKTYHGEKAPPPNLEFSGEKSEGPVIPSAPTRTPLPAPPAASPPAPRPSRTRSAPP